MKNHLLNSIDAAIPHIESPNIFINKLSQLYKAISHNLHEALKNYEDQFLWGKDSNDKNEIKIHFRTKLFQLIAKDHSNGITPALQDPLVYLPE